VELRRGFEDAVRICSSSSNIFLQTHSPFTKATITGTKMIKKMSIMVSALREEGGYKYTTSR
jgi:hypothetical protein